jgi:hypothetical protein
MSLDNAIRKAYLYNKKVGRKKIYLAIDIHDTIAHSNYSDEMPQVIPEAAAAIKEIQEFPEIVLILYSSSYKPQDHIEHFKLNGLKFTYFNENPEICDTNTGDFSKKFFYNVLIDDKAGFEQEDWIDVVEAIKVYRVGFLAEEKEPPQPCKFELEVYEENDKNYILMYEYTAAWTTGPHKFGPFLSKQSAITDRTRKINEYIKAGIPSAHFSSIEPIKVYL